MPPADLSVPVPYDDARRLASEHGWREKALVYVTRAVDELLVLEHSEESLGAGVQVPAGGVEPDEDPARAAERELFEETGLRVTGPATHLVSHYWTTDEAPSRIRHYYWLTAPLDAPDSWLHVVSAGKEDVGILFRLSFRPLRDPKLTPGYGWECGLTLLSTVLARR